MPLAPDSQLVGHVFPSDRRGPSACAAYARYEFARCLVSSRFAGDRDAQRFAGLLFDRMHVVSGPDTPGVMDDGDYRGPVVLESALPLREHVRHLVFLNMAFDEFEHFFSRLATHAKAPIRFIFRGINLRFYRTVEGRTPSAYVQSSNIGYNVNGELFDSYEDARDTLFHELFHINDALNARWSKHALTKIYETVLDTCKDDEKCFDAHAPFETKVDGGIYYAFHPTSNVREYAAELAIRYLREQSTALAGRRIGSPFKCENPANRLAWDLLVQKFFGAVDRVPECSPK